MVIVALEVPLGSNLDKRVNAEVEAASAGQTQVIAATVAEQLDKPTVLARSARLAGSQLEGSVVVVDRRGRLLAGSQGGTARGVTVATPARPELLTALDGRVSQERRGSGDAESLFTGVPIVRGGRTIGAVGVSQGVKSVNSAVRDDIAALIGIAARRRLYR